MRKESRYWIWFAGLGLAAIFSILWWTVPKPPLASLEGSDLWFVERWCGDPPSTGVATAMYASVMSPEETCQRVMSELGLKARRGQSSICMSGGRTFRLIRVDSVNQLRDTLGGNADYPPLPAGTRSVVWIAYHEEPLAVSVKCWLFARKWRGSVE